MAPSSSSTKKAARLAQKGKGRTVRFQGGTLFPVVVSIVIVVGLALVFYARSSRPSADASAPAVDDHWHHVYGFYLCDSWFQLSGDAEEVDASGSPLNTEYARTGIHSHDDGIIHWHPFTSAAVGSRARLGVFLDVYDVELGNDRLVFPEDQRAGLPHQQETGVFEEGETECELVDADGDVSVEDGELRVVVWENYTDTGEGQTYIAGFDDIRLDQDAMVVTIGFVPSDVDLEMPPWASELEERAAADTGQPTASELFPDADIEGIEDDVPETVPAAPSDDAPADTTATTDAAGEG